MPVQSKYIKAFLSPHLPAFNFEYIDSTRPIDSYSCKSSIKNSSSGILEVLHDLEGEDNNQAERGMQAKSSSTQSHPNSLTNAGKTKRFCAEIIAQAYTLGPEKNVY